MGYIMDLRKYVGHQALIMVGACVLILNEKKEVLLQRRTDNGFWAYPGGSMEPGESFEECAKREVLEETGLECLHLSYFTNNSGEEMHYTYPNGDEVYIAEVVFLCDKYSGRLKVQEEEAIEQRFFDLNNLPENISPINEGVIQMLVEEFNGKRDAAE